MDWKQLQDKIQNMTPAERVARFAELDAWFDANPAAATPATVEGPSGIPSTDIGRADKGIERSNLALQIARDSVRARAS